eukprot:4981482-Prymnesium_polylepis.1
MGVWLGRQGIRWRPGDFMGDNLSAQQIEWNLTLQHYRGRVEHVIGQLVRSWAALNSKWRGSFSLLAAIMKI